MPKKIEKKLNEEKVVKKGKATEIKVDAKIKKADKKAAINKTANGVDKKTASKKNESKELGKAATSKIANKKVTNNKNTGKIVSKNSKLKVGKSQKDVKKVTKVEKTTKIENSKKHEYLQEYYDLPYRYNETIVTILAQTPKRLFVYWDISDKDKETYRKAFGDDFFEKTYPVLLVHNEELNYTFEVPINDFANSWYLDIQDSKKNYVVQLGRKFKNVQQAKDVNIEVLKEEKINLQNDFVYITDSNKLESPNDHILFELLSNQVTYRNVKDGSEYKKELKDLVKDLNNSYPAEIVHELYTKLYSEEIAKEEFGRKNPASGEFGLPTSSGALRSSGQW